MDDFIAGGADVIVVTSQVNGWINEPCLTCSSLHVAHSRGNLSFLCNNHMIISELDSWSYGGKHYAPKTLSEHRTDKSFTDVLEVAHSIADHDYAVKTMRVIDVR